MSFFKTLAAAVTAWVFVAFLVMAFFLTPLSTWNPLAQDFGGWAQLFLGLVLLAGLILFGFGAVLWTFIYPVVRPRMLVSRWGVQTVVSKPAVVSKPGGRITLFAAAWSDISEVDGFYTATRLPFVWVLHGRITARGKSVEHNALIRSRKKHTTFVHTVSGMLQGRARDVLAFLIQVQNQNR